MARNPGGNGDLPPELLPHRWISYALDLTCLPPVGSKVIYFPQGHFEQWAEHLAAPAPPAGHSPSFLCTVTYLDIVVAAHAPYAVVSLTPVPLDGLLGAAPAVLPNTRPTTSFVYNIKTLSETDLRPSFPLPKVIQDTVLPKHGAELKKQQLEMVDIEGRRWSFTHQISRSGTIYYLRGKWKDFTKAKNAGEHDKVYFLHDADGRLFIELQNAANSNQAAAQRLAAIPLDPGEEIAEAANLSSQGREFTATYYPHKRLGKFFVPPREVDEAMGIEWAAGMEVSLRKDVLQHTTEPRYSSETVTGTVKAVTDSTWRGLR
ncbi:hypothetical protein ACQ4PT_054142 [Festuca glaucescens]